MHRSPTSSLTIVAATSCLLGVCATAASGSVVTPVNGGFEAPLTPTFTTTVNDWTTFNSADRTITQAGTLNNQEGNQFLVLDDRGSGSIGVFQNLGTIEVGFTYTLDLKVAEGNNPIPGVFSYGLHTGITNGFGSGNTIVSETQATDIGGGVTLSQEITSNAGTFLDRSISFDTIGGNNAALVGQDLFVRLSIDGGSGPGNADQLYFDAVTVTAVPEPGSVALAGLGGLALLVRCRKA